MKKVLDTNPNTLEHWEEVYKNNEYDMGADQLKHHFIASQLINGSFIVDYGCGLSELIDTIYLMKPKCKVIGVDHVIYKPLTKDNLSYIQGDVYTNVTTSADYVLSTEVLEHLDDPQRHVKCLFDSLKEEGIAMLSTPLMEMIPSTEHVWEFNYDDIRYLFKMFSQIWILPYSSNRVANFKDGRVSPSGNIDTIFVKEIK